MELKDQDHDPIDACYNCIETEWGMEAVILAPDGAARVVVRAIVGTFEGVLQFSISLWVKWSVKGMNERGEDYGCLCNRALPRAGAVCMRWVS